MGRNHRNFREAVGEAALTIMAWTIGGPLIGIWYAGGFARQSARKLRLGIREANNRRKARQRQARMKPSRTLPVKSRTGRQTCALLTRLPREVRDNIWFLVVGGQEMEFGRGETLLDPELPKQTIPNRLALLRTCQQVYEEAGLTFYTTAHFTFLLVGACSKYALHEFRASLPIAQWETIRHVKLYYGFYYVCELSTGCVWPRSEIILDEWGPKQWPAVCDALASLTGLQSLTVVLAGAYKDEYDGAFRELEKVTVPTKYEVLTTSTWPEEFERHIQYTRARPFEVGKAVPEGAARHMSILLPNRGGTGIGKPIDMAKAFALDEAIAETWEDATCAPPENSSG